MSLEDLYFLIKMESKTVEIFGWDIFKVTDWICFLMKKPQASRRHLCWKHTKIGELPYPWKKESVPTKGEIDLRAILNLHKPLCHSKSLWYMLYSRRLHLRQPLFIKHPKLGCRSRFCSRKSLVSNIFLQIIKWSVCK